MKRAKFARFECRVKGDSYGALHDFIAFLNNAGYKAVDVANINARGYRRFGVNYDIYLDDSNEPVGEISVRPIDGLRFDVSNCPELEVVAESFIPKKYYPMKKRSYS